MLRLAYFSQNLIIHTMTAQVLQTTSQALVDRLARDRNVLLLHADLCPRCQQIKQDIRYLVSALSPEFLDNGTIESLTIILVGLVGLAMTEQEEGEDSS